MDYRDYSDVQETDGWKPVRDASWSAGRRPYDSTAYGVRDDGYDDRLSGGPVTATAVIESEPGAHAITVLPHYSTIKELPPAPYHPSQPADLQPTGTVGYPHQPWTPNHLPPGASYGPPPGTSYEPPPGAGYQPPSYRPPPGPSRPRPPPGNANRHGPSRITVAVSSPESAASDAEKKVDWKLIGIAALVKLGLVKLKAFALLNALLSLLLKFKAFAVATVFKFALLLKLLKFFKVLLVPSLLALLSPLALSALHMFPSQALPMPNNSSAAALPGLPSVLSGLPSILPPGQLTNPTQGLLPGVLGPGRPGVPSTVRPTGQGGSALRPAAFAKSDDSQSLRRGRLHESPPDSFHPTLEVFRELLDSERCVERIACRMAAAEKSGAMPPWINW